MRLSCSFFWNSCQRLTSLALVLLQVAVVIVYCASFAISLETETPKGSVVTAGFELYSNNGTTTHECELKGVPDQFANDHDQDRMRNWPCEHIRQNLTTIPTLTTDDDETTTQATQLGDSFRCWCRPGYTVDRADPWRCTPIHDPHGLVYFAVKGMVYQWNYTKPEAETANLPFPHTTFSQESITLLVRLDNIIFYVKRPSKDAILYSIYGDNQLFHCDPYATKIANFRGCIDAVLPVPQFDEPGQVINSLSVDWIHRSLYLSSSSQIVLCNIKGYHDSSTNKWHLVCGTVVSVPNTDRNATRIQGVVVRPTEFQLIYSMVRIEDGNRLVSSLVQTDLSGRHGQLLHTRVTQVGVTALPSDAPPEEATLHRLGFTNLALDVPNDRLCWLYQDQMYCAKLIKDKLFKPSLVNLTNNATTQPRISMFSLASDRILWRELTDNRTDLIYWTLLMGNSSTDQDDLSITSSSITSNITAPWFKRKPIPGEVMSVFESGWYHTDGTTNGVASGTTWYNGCRALEGRFHNLTHWYREADTEPGGVGPCVHTCAPLLADEPTAQNYRCLCPPNHRSNFLKDNQCEPAVEVYDQQGLKDKLIGQYCICIEGGPVHVLKIVLITIGLIIAVGTLLRFGGYTIVRLRPDGTRPWDRLVNKFGYTRNQKEDEKDR